MKEPLMETEGGGFDARTLRKEITRKLYDYSLYMFQSRFDSYEKRFYRDTKDIKQHPAYAKEFSSSFSYGNNPNSMILSESAFTAVNRQRCKLNGVRWSPEGKRLLVAGKTGEMTLWDGASFHFETLMQAHDTGIEELVWSKNGDWLITSDTDGKVKYWQRTLNNVKVFQAHRDPVVDLSFSPNDNKFATASADRTIKIWDFLEAKEEICLTGHCWDVRSVSWHPKYSLIASGGRDNTIKLWDPRESDCIKTFYNHKNSVTSVKWSPYDENIFISCGRDNLIHLFDLRATSQPKMYRGHKKDVLSMTWHPLNNLIFVSGGYDGCLNYWNINIDTPIHSIETAHDTGIVGLDFHPFGHALATGCQDGTTRFWIKQSPKEPEVVEDLVENKGIPGLGDLNTADDDSEEESEEEDVIEDSEKKDTIIETNKTYINQDQDAGFKKAKLDPRRRR
eukprot:GHVP01024339.1.p1 GENE.GHVP01024339.1~~GHVP01024339.1.p1  ORF type:complete len:450 (+),score=81.45 GHVP01024339.1:3-1352(+)